MSAKAIDLVGSTLKGDAIVPFLVEVRLPVETQTERDAFLKVRETLTRIGIASRRVENELYQTCHILSKRGRYYIVHFKCLFLLDGRENDIRFEDVARQNRIVNLLRDWGLVEVVNPDMIDHPVACMGNLKVISHTQKSAWVLKPKYQLGKPKKPNTHREAN